MDRISAKLAFFIEKKSRRGHGGTMPREVTAVFTDSGNYKMKDCYSHDGQHGVCAVDWISENCRPAHYAEFKPLYDELNGTVGYDIEVVDSEWWLATAMSVVRSMNNYYSSGKVA